MSKVLVLSAMIAAAAPLTACTPDTPVTPLASFHGATLTLMTANDAQLIEPGVPSPTRLVISAATGDCVRVGDDVTADLDGARMTAVNRGGAWSAIDASGCDDIEFDLDQVPTTRGASTLLVRDSGTTWTITSEDMFANNFRITDMPVAGQRAHIEWLDAAAIDLGVYVQLEQNNTVVFNAYTAAQVTTTGDMIAVAMPPGVTGDGTLSINAARTVTATRCEGPATCVLSVGAGIDLPVTIAAAAPNPAIGPVAAIDLAR